MLHVMRHHGVLGRGVRVSGEGALFVLIVVVFAIFLAHKVLWTLVLVCAAILRNLSVSCTLAQLSIQGSRGCIRIGTGQWSR
jgi:hypothetical protein